MTTRGPAGINVTPLIDVLLVLLIIFMVVMPKMLEMEPVQMPRDCPDCLPEIPPVVVKLNADLTVSIDEEAPMMGSELAARMHAKVALTKDVILDVEDGVPWREVLATVDNLRGVAEDTQHDSIKVGVRMRPAP